MPVPDFIESAPSLASAVSRAFTVFGAAPHLGSRDTSGRWRWRSYAETGEEAAALAAGLASAVGLPRRSGVGILSRNREEWLLTDWACALDDFLVLGIHPAWDAAKVAHVLADAQLSCVVVSAEALPLLIQAKLLGAPQLSLAVLLPGDGSERDAEAAEAAGLRIVRYSDVLAAGRQSRATHTGAGFGADAASRPDPADDNDAVFTLMYSSGTSGGPPKAVATPKSTWRKTNLVGPLAGIASPDDRRAVSYMPLAHGADRGVCWFTTMAGGRIGMVAAEPGTDEFYADLKEVKPAFLLGMSCAYSARHSLGAITFLI